MNSHRYDRGVVDPIGVGVQQLLFIQCGPFVTRHLKGQMKNRLPQ